MKKLLSLTLVAACVGFMSFGAHAQNNDKLMTLEVKSVALDVEQPSGSIKTVAENGKEIEFSGDRDLWFTNATVKDFTLPKGSEIKIALNAQSGKSQFLLVDGSKVVAKFKVDGKTYPISIFNGSKLIVRKSPDGTYALLPKETAKLSPPPPETVAP